MAHDVTAVYYTAHLEPPEMESAIRDVHREMMGDIPLISVSQQPLDYGHNICVGEVGVSSHNAFRQLQLGAMAAETPFVCAVEAACLYPPSYFQFVPGTIEAICVPFPVYVLFLQQHKARRFYLKPGGLEGAMIVARNTLITIIADMLKDAPAWVASNAGQPRMRHPFTTYLTTDVRLPHPVLTLKTDHNMGRRTPFARDTESTSVDFWGTVADVRRIICA